MVGPWSEAVAQGGPVVDEIRTLPFPGFTRRDKANLLAPYVMLVRAAATLRRDRYDLAVVFRPDHWWGALLALAAGIPLRVGTATPETEPLLTHAISPAADHAVEQAHAVARTAIRVAGCRPVEAGDARQFTVSDAARHEAAAVWSQHGLEGRRVVALQPTAGAGLKTWPPRRWSELADRLVALGAAVVLVGAPEDTGVLNAIAEHMTHSVPRLTGQSIDVSAALYERCALLVCVDGGGGHLAAAVGTATVRMYGPASPAIFGPWPRREGQRVLITDALSCVPCGEFEAPPCGARALPACLLALGVEDVLNAARAELDRR